MSTQRQKIDDQIDPTIVTDPNTPKVTMYCINTCSTCKTARKALEGAGYAVMWKDVRGKDMGLEDWQHLEETVGWEKLVNTSSQTWRNLDDADKQGLDRDKAIELLVKKPTLMKRPAIDRGDEILLGWTADTKSALEIA